MKGENVLINDDDAHVLKHYGILRKSGRYPWGSGKNPYQRSMSFMSYIDDLKAKGMTEVEIANAFDMTTTELRATKSIAKDEFRAANAATVLKLKDKGYSNVAIAERMGMPESSVRALMNPAIKDRTNITKVTAEMLRDQVADKKYIDIGKGTENHIGISPEKLKTAIAILKDEGYEVMYYRAPQLGTGELTSIKALVPPGTSYSEFYQDAKAGKIQTIAKGTSDGGRSYHEVKAPESVSSKRIEVNYAETGGSSKDGLIELRPGVKDLDLGSSRYAQVRIAVDDSHYLKGVAVYAQDLPDGVDIRFNTNKTKDTPKLDTMKPLKLDSEGKVDLENPFGATIKPNGQRGALNIVNEEGDWYNWSQKLSSQMLSKQSPELAQKQLGLTYDIKQEEFNDIMALTNPTIQKRLLKSFADDMDASAVHLKAASLPQTRNHVILPIPSMKETEIFAPNYADGEKVVLIRHPHGGIFEIPELTVNNKSRTARQILGSNARDAVGINPKVAEQLSGADFDGDTVLVIPNHGKTVKNSAPLKALENFDPKTYYPGYPGMKTMTNTQTEMGVISNLITDMTVKGAHPNEIARAVRHSMVVIDAEKHGLNYKQSYVDNGIAELKAIYQANVTSGKPSGGASTLISRAKSQAVVPQRKARPAALGGSIDRETGEKRYVETGETYVKRSISNADAERLASERGIKVSEVRKLVTRGEITGPFVKETVTPKTQKSTKMAEARDAYELSSGTPIESVYADHANRLKALANQARREYLRTPNLTYSPSAAKTYAKEVESLVAKLNVALMNAPLERQAQMVANVNVKLREANNPDLDNDDLKKIKSQELARARERVGAKKTLVDITPSEWDAIQAGAISNNRLSQILDNADVDALKQLAMPRTSTGLSPAMEARARSMAATGYTQADIAAALGVSVSTVVGALDG